MSVLRSRLSTERCTVLTPGSKLSVATHRVISSEITRQEQQVEPDLLSSKLSFPLGLRHGSSYLFTVQCSFLHVIERNSKVTSKKTTKTFYVIISSVCIHNYQIQTVVLHSVNPTYNCKFDTSL